MMWTLTDPILSVYLLNEFEMDKLYVYHVFEVICIINITINIMICTIEKLPE